MTKVFLEENPFYILEVSPSDKRAYIIQKAEEKAFFTDDNRCNDAQMLLLNPEKRLTAELDWFYDISREEVEKIKSSISSKTAIDTNMLTNISKLNAVLYNFSISVFKDYFELDYALINIAEQFESLNSESLCITINNCHQQAGIREITKDELENELNKKREQIRQIIGVKTDALAGNEYIALVTMIAEKCIADDSYEDGIILSDIISLYEVKMQSTIEDANEKILSHIGRIKTLATHEEIEPNLTELIACVKQWDVLVQPLQLNSQAKGVVHRDSRNIGGEIRGLSVWLHNEKSLSELALKLVEAMKPVFAELIDLADMFKTDGDTLANFIRDNKDAEQAIAEINSIKAQGEQLKSFATRIKTEEFINKVKAANKKIKSISLDAETISKIRENICCIARDVAITLHNEKKETEYALSISQMLAEEFSDLPLLREQLSKDLLALSTQLVMKSRVSSQPSVSSGSSNNTGCLGWVISIIIIVILFVWIRNDSDTSSNSSTSSTYSPSPIPTLSTEIIQTPTPTITPTIEPIPEVEAPVSGTILEGHEYNNASEITVTASSGSSTVVKLKTGAGETRVSFYVRAGEKVTVGVPTEYLYVYFASGQKWYGTTHLFGENTRYSKNDEVCDFTQYTWEYTLYPVANGNFSQTVIDEDEF